ncbi:MAG TPA: glycosyltransferase family 39 protein, partial [Acidobacteriota bacterium]|nr:glycosyltransferase family 39 protein [Acidobacteriota bacterium]
MQYRRYIFWAIVFFAAIVRFKGLSSGLPLHTLYGENDTFQTLQQMLHSGDLNPHQFVYPALAYYIYLPFLYLFYAIGLAFGYFDGISTVPDASWIFIGRCVSAFLGTASVVLAYRVGRYFSEAIALLAMTILSAVPQHIEFSHMLRPEIPAIFFLLLAQWLALEMLSAPRRRTFLLFGLAAGACFCTKYNIGLPLLISLAVGSWLNRQEIRWHWPLESFLVFGLTFAAINPLLVVDPPTMLYWIRRLDSYYVPSEDYYGKGVVFYYLEYLTRYNYNLPLILAAILGIVVTAFRNWKRGLLLAAYPLGLFLWLCTFESRRIHGLLPLHPYLALWAASTLIALWQGTRRISGATFFRIAYSLLLCAILFFPFYRSCVQTYLLSRADNRSKAELWITNQLPRGSRIALLQYHQIELDPDYFQIQNFSPREYAGARNFHWFAEQGFDYVVLSSGQYMRYFVEGPRAESYKDYFLRFFQDASREGTLVLDLITHPTLIPDYRI